MRDKYKECIARHNLYSILREIHEGKKRNVYCAAGFKAISIDIDGYIYIHVIDLWVIRSFAWGMFPLMYLNMM